MAAATDQKVSPTSNSSVIPTWMITAGMVLAGLAAYILALLLPLPSAWASLFRHGYSLWLVGALMIFFVLYRIPQKWGRTLAFSLTLILFALPLAGLWRAGFGEMQIIGGMLSFSDSARYYYEANRLLSGFAMTSFGARHPFAPGLLAVLLWLTHQNLQWTLAVWVLLNAIAVYIAARTLQQSHGALPAALFVLLAFLFYRRFIGMTDTENLGFLLGMLAFSFLWQGALQKDQRWALVGFFFSGMALNARPGAMFVLPAQLIWLLHTFSDGKKLLQQKIFWQSAGLLVLAFVLNSALVNALNPGGQLFSNYGYTLYGIADGGSGWEQVFIDHPELRAVNENEAARLSARFAMEKLIQNPLPALRSAALSLFDFFSTKDQSAFGFVSGGDLGAFDHPQPAHFLANLITRLLLWGMSLLGAAWAWWDKKNPRSALLLWAALGIILSIQFAPPRDAALMRVYAASMPFLFLVPLTGLMFLRGKLSFFLETEPAGKTPFHLGMGMGMVVVLLMLAGPLLLRCFRQQPPLPAFSCPEGQIPAVIQVHRGAYLAITPDAELDHTHLPQIRQEDFLASLRQFPYGEVIGELGTLAPPVWVMNAIDLRQEQMLWVVLPEALLPVEPAQRYDRSFGVCGTWMPEIKANGLGFLQVVELQELD